MGTHNVKWAKRQYVHNFFAFMFMFCYTECKEAYHAFMTEFMTLPVKFFRMAAGSVPKVYSGSLDRSPAIANAYISVISACIVLLQCWLHISRKFKEGDFRNYFNMVDNMAPIEEHVTKLHFTQTDLMFRWLGKVLVVYWTGPMKEGRWATKFFAIYMEGHWGAQDKPVRWNFRWFVCFFSFAFLRYFPSGLVLGCIPGGRLCVLVMAKLGPYSPTPCLWLAIASA